MTKMNRRLAAVGAIVMLVCVPWRRAAAAQAKVDVTGKWAFNVETSAGAGAPTFTFKQDGEKLTGHYTGTFGEADLTGTVKGADITFSFTVDAQGTALKEHLHRHGRQGHHEGQARHRRARRGHLHGEETVRRGVRGSRFEVRGAAFEVRRVVRCSCLVVAYRSCPASAGPPPLRRSTAPSSTRTTARAVTMRRPGARRRRTR